MVNIWLTYGKSKTLVWYVLNPCHPRVCYGCFCLLYRYPSISCTTWESKHCGYRYPYENGLMIIPPPQELNR